MNIINQIVALFIVAVILLTGFTSAIPKQDQDGKNFPENPWRRAYYDEQHNDTANNINDRTQRLGFSTGYGGIGYPQSGTGVGVYNPVKLDLGGVVLGTLIGIGAILIIPKLIGVVSGGYGGHYARSSDNELSGLTDLLAKIDDALGQNNIDSTSCMQRAVCSYIRSTEKNVKLGSNDQIDEFVHLLSGNSLVEYMLDGTAIREALENGKNMSGQECDALYSGCPLDSGSAMKVLTKLMPKNAQQNTN